MRPIKLTVQGLTSYRDSMEVDFSDLDLFAITGPTGSGKSSLVDAITYALYGQVPRVGKNIKELISQGADRLKVELEFTAGGVRYRIHRATARRGSTPVQVERLDAPTNEWQPEEADRVREINKFIEDLLRMDYDAFIRSVLLPQGEFQEFLAGDRDQRRKVLDGLLQLGVYAVMGQKANALAAKHGDEAERIKTRLETELRDATPEALAAAREDLAALEEQVEHLRAEREALEATCRAAETLSSARTQEHQAREKANKSQEQLDLSLSLREEGQQLLEALDAEITSVREKTAAAGYDPDLHLRVKGAEPLARHRDELTERQNRIAEDMRQTAAQAEHLGAVHKEAVELLTETLRTAETAKDAYDEARRLNAAALLRQGLTPGDACPVCGQAVSDVAAAEHRDLDQLKTAKDSASDAAAKAKDAVGQVEIQLKMKSQEADQLAKAAEQAKSDRDSVLLDLTAVLLEPETPLADIRQRIGKLETAKKDVEALKDAEKALTAKHAQQDEAIRRAQDDVTRLQLERASHAADADKALNQAAETNAAIRNTAAARGWDDVLAALEDSADASLILRRNSQTTQAHETEANRRIGADRVRIEQIVAGIERAESLRGEEREHRGQAVLARDLATLLRADRFPAFIRDEAMKTLAAGGSEWLQKISQGRYDLIVEGQDFEVEDQWNAGSRRSVKTLSGGETFMASLSLALALAEQLPGLSGEGGASALESLFIDEGFSNLDTQTLDDVASALEVLGQDRRRLIGVITHVPALAERMPARIVVHKSQTGSTVTVE